MPTMLEQFKRGAPESFLALLSIDLKQYETGPEQELGDKLEDELEEEFEEEIEQKLEDEFDDDLVDDTDDDLVDDTEEDLEEDLEQELGDELKDEPEQQIPQLSEEEFGQQLEQAYSQALLEQELAQAASAPVTAPPVAASNTQQEADDADGVFSDDDESLFGDDSAPDSPSPAASGHAHKRAREEEEAEEQQQPPRKRAKGSGHDYGTVASPRLVPNGPLFTFPANPPSPKASGHAQKRARDEEEVEEQQQQQPPRKRAKGSAHDYGTVAPACLVPAGPLFTFPDVAPKPPNPPEGAENSVISIASPSPASINPPSPVAVIPSPAPIASTKALIPTPSPELAASPAPSPAPVAVLPAPIIPSPAPIASTQALIPTPSPELVVFPAPSPAPIIPSPVSAASSSSKAADTGEGIIGACGRATGSPFPAPVLREVPTAQEQLARQLHAARQRAAMVSNSPGLSSPAQFTPRPSSSGLMVPRPSSSGLMVPRPSSSGQFIQHPPSSRQTLPAPSPFARPSHHQANAQRPQPQPQPPRVHELYCSLLMGQAGVSAPAGAKVCTLTDPRAKGAHAWCRLGRLERLASAVASSPEMAERVSLVPHLAYLLAHPAPDMGSNMVAHIQRLEGVVQQWETLGESVLAFANKGLGPQHAFQRDWMIPYGPDLALGLGQEGVNVLSSRLRLLETKILHWAKKIEVTDIPVPQNPKGRGKTVM